MSIRTGLATGLVEAASRVPDIAKLVLLEASAARFLRLLTQLRKDTRRLISPEYKVQERRPRGQTTTVNGNHNASVTTLTFTSVADFSPGDLILLPATQEQTRLITVDYSTNQVTVPTRGTMGSAANSITTGATVLRLGRVVPEGYTVGDSFVTSTSQVTNYVCSISTPVEWTNYVSKEASYISDDQTSSRVRNDEKAMAIEHLRELDRLLLFSRSNKSTDATTGRNLYFTQGVIPNITTNVYDHSGGTAITEDQFSRNIMEPGWRYNDSSLKYMFVANKTVTEIDRFGNAKLQWMDNETKTLGFEVSGYKSSRGLAKMIYCPHLDAASYYDESLVLLDFNFLQLAIYMDTEYKRGIQPPNQNTTLNEWRSCIGTSQEYEETNVFARDLRTAA